MPKRTNLSGAEEHPLAEPMSRQEAREIADAVVRARKRAGMTQAEIARAMGITQSAFSRLENAATLPSVRTLQRFARATSSRLHLSIDPVSNHDSRIASHTMTDTLSRSGFSTDRRRFLGGAMGLAGMFGIGNVRYVTAQEATAAATAVADYVWTAPAWGEERSLFTIIERNEETALVETINGQIEVPSSPKRLVTLSDEYIPLFELGYTDPIVAIGNSIPGFDSLINAGELTDDLQRALAGIPIVRTTSVELDFEVLIGLQPDLVLGGRLDEIYATVTEVAPFIHRDFRVTDVPRAAVRDLGALFGIGDTATRVLADHETYVARAREAIAPAIEGKRVMVMEFWPDSNELQVTPSYYLTDGKPAVLSLGYPFFRELGFTPTNFVEALAEQDERNMFFYVVSLEEFGNIDADMVFFSGTEEELAKFLALPLVQLSRSFKNNAIYRYDRDGYGFGLAGMRAAVKGIVEAATGEPFA
jgi:ABC-type Fe3+-hydroxamate transport system substrate-binding protein/DNA-binding XRE family transcriptional regulator